MKREYTERSIRKYQTLVERIDRKLNVMQSDSPARFFLMAGWLRAKYSALWSLHNRILDLIGDTHPAAETHNRLWVAISDLQDLVRDLRKEAEGYQKAVTKTESKQH